jgi:DNA-binding response OmpR family regulator
MARVRSILRRSAADELDRSTGPLRVGNLKIDPTGHEVRVNGDLVELSPREFELLRFLAMHPDQVFTRAKLLHHVWGADAYVEERTVDVHIRWLREKTEADPSQPSRILTVRGVGYKMRGEPDGAR